jgi:hypothetical protein
VLSPRLITLRSVEPVAGAAAELHTRVRIGRVIVVHGTFVGNDPFAVAETLKSLGSGVPLIGEQLEKMAEMIQQNTQPVTNSVIQDMGTYTEVFRDQFQSLVGDDPVVELLNPTWSSQNHHFARADLAVRLIHQMLMRPPMPGQRILLWGHSHAGNAFAMLTNLLANERNSVDQFFAAVGEQEEPHWKTVQNALRSVGGPHPLSQSVVIVAFGTPVRYGWDVHGCAQLIHVLHHRPHDPATPFLTKPLFPPQTLPDVMSATWGDWIQAFAVAGTDVVSAATLDENDRLTNLLERNLVEPVHELDTRFIPTARLRNTCYRWKQGTRCHTDGLNLLLNYQPSGESVLGLPLESTVFGHGVATTVKWLPAHLRLVLDSLH